MPARLGMTAEAMKSADGRAVLAAPCRKSVRADPDGWGRLARAVVCRIEIDGKENVDDPLVFVLEQGAWKLDLASDN